MVHNTYKVIVSSYTPRIFQNLHHAKKGRCSSDDSRSKYPDPCMTPRLIILELFSFQDDERPVSIYPEVLAHFYCLETSLTSFKFGRADPFLFGRSYCMQCPYTFNLPRRVYLYPFDQKTKLESEIKARAWAVVLSERKRKRA